MKLLLFGRILNPASKWATVKQSGDYAFPVVKGDVQDYNIYDALDFIYEHRSAIFNRINTNMVNKYGRTTKKVFYDVTNFFFEIDEPDEDLSLPNGSVERGLRQKGVSKENRKSPIVQMGLLMDEQGIPVSIECFPGNTLDMLTLSKAFSNSVSSISNGKERYIYVCDKGIGKGEAIQYAVSRGMGYITSRTVRGSCADEKKWILDQEGYKVVNENFRYKRKPAFVMTAGLLIYSSDYPLRNTSSAFGIHVGAAARIAVVSSKFISSPARGINTRPPASCTIRLPAA
jgi:transposase